MRRKLENLFLNQFALRNLINFLYLRDDAFHNRLDLILQKLKQLVIFSCFHLDIIDSLDFSLFHISDSFLYPSAPIHFVCDIERNAARL